MGEILSRSVPRAVRSTNAVLRFVCIATQVGCAAIIVWHLDEIVIKFIRYETTTTLREVFDESIFPWVTVCNQSPVGDTIRIPRVPTTLTISKLS